MKRAMAVRETILLFDSGLGGLTVCAGRLYRQRVGLAWLGAAEQDERLGVVK